jgi:excisionase family DNA binding protein
MTKNNDNLDGAKLDLMTSLELVTPMQLASYLKISRGTIQRFVTRGVPHERLGSRVYFKIDDVVAWLRDQGRAARRTRKR